MVLFLGFGPSFVNPGVRSPDRHLDQHQEGASSQWSASILLGGALPLSGSCPLGWGTAFGDCHDVAQTRVCLFISLVYFLGNMLYSFFKSIIVGFSIPLGMLVANWVPTPCYNDAFLVGTPKWALWGKGWLKHCKTTISPFLGRFFLVSKRTFYFLGVVRWMLHIGRARHPGPGSRDFPSGQLSVEFINVGGWLTSGDLALDSCAQFLAVAEHRLIPSRARSVCYQRRKAGHHSVWAPACQDKIAGGHAGVGVISLGGAPLSLPSFVTPQFQEFFRLGQVLRTTLPTSQGGVVHLFVVYGYQGAEEDAEKLRLTDHLLQAVLVEAQMVCIGQPMLIAGDLNADPAVIPCLAKGISAGRYVDLALGVFQGGWSFPSF